MRTIAVWCPGWPEARDFEPVVRVLESIAPGVELTRPGLAAIAARGPTRYFGGEDGVLHALARALTAIEGIDVTIGVADGAFAAELAAQRGMIVAPGESGPFLAALPVSTLGDPELADLLWRLGLRTLGAFAALPARDVFGRFGPNGAWLHRQAGGRDDRPVAARRPPVELAATLRFEPPVDRIDTVAFSARAKAEEFIADLAAHGFACTCFELQASTANGEQTARRWRHTGVLGSRDVLDRIRWQLQGWTSGADKPSAGITELQLIPLETVPVSAHQQALWGGSGENDERAERAFARVQTMLGHGSVLRPVLSGGRDPGTRTHYVVWGDQAQGEGPVHSPQQPALNQPWPGALPAPAPSVLFDPPRPARVLDGAGQPVVVTSRGAVVHPPARFAMGDETPVAVTAWAGPWPIDERWWDVEQSRRAVRCQIVDARGRAYLVSWMQGDPDTWRVDALYD